MHLGGERKSVMKKSFLYFGIILLLMSFIFGMNGCTRKQTLKAEEATVAQKAPEAGQTGSAKTQPEATPEQQTPAAQPPAQEMKESAPAAQAPAETVQPETVQSYEPADIYFGFDMYNLSQDDRKILDEYAAWLAKNPGSLIIEGNCDERGTIEYNLALGQRRAEEAKKYLVGLGIDPSRIKTISYGKERPLDPGHNEDAWAKNRRDHFIITKSK